MTQDELEFLISQYLDGTLDAAERAKLDHALATRPDARSLLAEHEKLNTLLRDARAPIDVDAEWLTAQIAGQIDEEPAPSFKIHRWLSAGRLAVAAVVAAALTVGLFAWNADRGGSRSNGDSVRAIAKIELASPAPEAARGGTSFAAVSVGIPANLTPALVSALYLSDASMQGNVTIRPAGPSYRSDFD